MITNVRRSSCRGSDILVGFKLNSNFLEIFSKNTKIQNIMNIRPVGAELFHVEGRTDGRTGRQTVVKKV